MGFRRGTMTLTEGVTPSDKRNDLFIIHRHTLKRRTDILGSSHVITTGIRALWVHIDKPHVGGC